MRDTTEHLAAARIKVEKWRTEGNSEQLAESLEGLASVLLKEVDLVGAASALEEAAGLWSDMSSVERQGSCLLLAASSHRLAGDLDGAKHTLNLGFAAKLPRKLENGFQVEWCEQELASGRYDSARNGFTRVLSDLADELNPIQQAQLYQRRAAAAVASKKWFDAADDFLHSSTIFTKQSLHAEAEVCALAAAAVLAEIDPASAERVILELLQTVPTDGSAATRRGLVGGKVAMQAGTPDLALKRFDQARQGALDVGDPLSYFSASVGSSHAAELLGDIKNSYARLATAWVSLSDVLGAETAAKMIRPEMEGLRDRLGADNFMAAKRQYEKERRYERT